MITISTMISSCPLIVQEETTFSDAAFNIFFSKPGEINK